MNYLINLIPYLVALMTLWDFSIHVIDWLKLDQKFIGSTSIFSYYYPHFWGKAPCVSQERGRKRYDYFWLTYWGTATILLIIYIVFR
jgi:hypothetical protein